MSAVISITEALLTRARVSPDALAYAVDGHPMTYSALLDDAQGLAGRLAARGVTSGDRCALVLPTGLDLIRAVYASQLIGAVPVAINPDLPDEAIARRLELVRARLAIRNGDARPMVTTDGRSRPACRVVTMTDLALGPGLPRSPRPPDAADPAFVQLTSGTTGEPRAVVISHRSLIASLAATADRLQMRHDDVLATWVPLHHDLGLVRYVFGAMFSGCPSHLIRPSMANLRPWLETIARVRATITGGPDSAYRLAARTVAPECADVRSLRFAGNGGETVRLSTIEQFERRFGLTGIVRPAYGLAEATLTVTSTAPGEDLRVDEHGAVSCGRPLDGIELRIGDVDGEALPTGSIGEVLVRGAAVFDGYQGDDEATADALRGGWLHTGDVGSIDAHGYLFLRGRSRALIKRGGMTIAPREVEDAVDRVADVHRSAAVGVALTSVSGTEDVVVVAEVRVASSDPPGAFDRIVASIDREVRRSVGTAPGRVFLVELGAIPRTVAGKVRYDELRRLVTENAFGGGLFFSR